MYFWPSQHLISNVIKLVSAFCGTKKSSHENFRVLFEETKDERRAGSRTF